MKVICDVHIARRIVRFFQSQGVEAIHVNDILDSWYTKDTAIAAYADQYNYVVVSKDADFKNSHLLRKSPKRLLKINLGNISTADLIHILAQHLEVLKEKFQLEYCLIEVDRGSITIIEMG